jgi:peptide deformylase
MNEDKQNESVTETTEEAKYRLRSVISDEDAMLLRSRSEDVPLAMGDNSGRAYPSADTNEVIQALKDYVTENDGLGMAAIQLGVAKRVFVMRWPWSSNRLVAVINPTIRRYEGSSKKPEGCFSLPAPDGVSAKVKRASRIWVDFTDENGVEYTDELLVGVDARVFQHELDHLNGYLMIDEKLPRGGAFLGWSRS